MDYVESSSASMVVPFLLQDDDVIDGDEGRLAAAVVARADPACARADAATMLVVPVFADEDHGPP